ncbi:UDP-N-acetylmuramoyl-L-alanyl-D-glutamate--2,6-diaminopimelate ligase [Haloplasma contractile]|uniref:UDP-N-acetylmuramoyl-L-alanyl-D-glutamate--2,6-diaminopimelate ligase n=1 Tax=Haloplasma contractile SSD-17B TaxID=1033810 RepID=F7PVI3_9MOLU|nr:UDP-N-acetylmuramoyl-L-alanyl-D-glutamate--2,6-diaminopimelate ligase [Haloplasma contractile]ERJ12849.1 UDP-N-acetylmuramoyl-L-alanyl-D-glutamate--2 6-diaminopimelate ligase 2 protein [Haloplasma contractile SSD-17B]
MTLSDILKKAQIHYNPSDVIDHDVHNITVNSNTVMSNDVFIAIKGETNDGHYFIRDAVKNGAKTIVLEDDYFKREDDNERINYILVHDTRKVVAILADLYYQQASRKVNLVGVTGTNGKTTITTLMNNMFRSMKIPSTLMGTNGIFLKEEKIKTINTTPSPIEINRLIRKSLDYGVKDVVMEVSSHAIKQQRVARLDYNTIIVTNFSHDHLDYHKTFDDYFYSKASLLSSLGSYPNGKKVLLNGDDKYFKNFLRLTNVDYYTYGVNEENDLIAKNIVCSLDSIEFDVYHHNKYLGTCSVHDMFGFFNVYNLLALIGYFYVNGYDMNEVFLHVKELNSSYGRMERVKNEYNLNIFIDYAHSPDSVWRIINEVKVITDKRIVCVIGTGGDRDKLKRPIIGKLVTNLADYVVFTSDNPRNEEPGKIINDILKGVSKNNYVVIEERNEAIKHAVTVMDQNDIVLILGKGHEHYQIINGKQYPFNDKIEVEKSIKKRFELKNKTLDVECE